MPPDRLRHERDILHGKKLAASAVGKLFGCQSLDKYYLALDRGHVKESHFCIDRNSSPHATKRCQEVCKVSEGGKPSRTAVKRIGKGEICKRFIELGRATPLNRKTVSGISESEWRH